MARKAKLLCKPPVVCVESFYRASMNPEDVEFGICISESPAVLDGCIYNVYPTPPAPVMATQPYVSRHLFMPASASSRPTKCGSFGHGSVLILLLDSTAFGVSAGAINSQFIHPHSSTCWRLTIVMRVLATMIVRIAEMSSTLIMDVHI
jgi:hypothetical protein